MTKVPEDWDVEAKLSVISKAGLAVSLLYAFQVLLVLVARNVLKRGVSFNQFSKS